MKTAKLILLCLSGMLAMQSATAQSRSEKKAQTERNVREAINADPCTSVKTTKAEMPSVILPKMQDAGLSASPIGAKVLK